MVMFSSISMVMFMVLAACGCWIWRECRWCWSRLVGYWFQRAFLPTFAKILIAETPSANVAECRYLCRLGR